MNREEAYAGSAIEGRFQFLHGFQESGLSAKGADDLARRADAVERVEGENLDVFDALDAGIGVLVEQGVEYGASLLAVAGEDIALANLLGALLARQRGAVEGDMADEVEGVEGLAGFFADFLG